MAQAQGSWFMAKTNLALGPGPGGSSAKLFLAVPLALGSASPQTPCGGLAMDWLSPHQCAVLARSCHAPASTYLGKSDLFSLEICNFASSSKLTNQDNESLN